MSADTHHGEKFDKKIKSISSMDVDSFKYVNTKIYQLDTLYKIESHRIFKRDTQLLELMKSNTKVYPLCI